MGFEGFNFKKESEKWNKILMDEGLGEEPNNIFEGEREQLGDGLGRKTKKEEELEDTNEWHSSTCPLNLGNSLDNSVNQPNDNPVEEEFFKKR